MLHQTVQNQAHLGRACRACAALQPFPGPAEPLLPYSFCQGLQAMHFYIPALTSDPANPEFALFANSLAVRFSRVLEVSRNGVMNKSETRKLTEVFVSKK